MFTFNRKVWFSPSSNHTKPAFSVVNVLTLTTTYFPFKTKRTYGWLIIDIDIVLSGGNKLIKVGQIPIWAWNEDFGRRSESRTYKCDLAYFRFLRKFPGKVFFLSTDNLITERDKIVEFTFEMSVNLAKQACSFDPSIYYSVCVCVCYILTKGKKSVLKLLTFKLRCLS